MLIQLFSDNNYGQGDLSKRVNKWLGDNKNKIKVLEIKYEPVVLKYENGGGPLCYNNIMIIYEELPKPQCASCLIDIDHIYKN